MQALLAEAYVHQLNPFAVHFFDNLGIRWYGLSYLAGFAVAWGLFSWLARTRRTSLATKEASDLLFYLILGVIVGGRLGYCIFYQPTLLIDPPILGVLQVWKGGMASHGGMIGVVVALVIYARRFQHSIPHLMDIVGFAAPPGLFFGRIANFVNAELWGKPLPADLQASPPAWSVKYPQELLTLSIDKIESLEPIRNLTSSDRPFADLARERHEQLNEALQQVIELAQAGNEQVIETLRPLLTAYYPSQIFQAISDGPALFLLLVVVWLWPRKPGVIAGSFLVGYPVMRIVTEVYRQPDEGVALLPTPFGDLSRGQVLSVLMVLCGLIIIVASARRQTPRVSGLLRKAAFPEPTHDSAAKK